ncbi:MAG: hypothetical protein ACKVH0_21355, partial [Alphaproteobacteria bacterium]
RLGRDISLNEGVVQGTSSTGEAWKITITPLDLSDSRQLRPGQAGQFIAYDALLQIEGKDGRALDLRSVRLGPRQ